MTSVQANGVRLEVNENGTGEPLVLVHGSWDDRHTWAAVEEPLAQSFRVVTYDRRGHSDSDDAGGPGSRGVDEDDLADLVETLDLAPAHFVGNSFGASIVLGLGARRPDLVRSLCAHEPPLFDVASDDPGVVAFGRVVEPVVELIEDGEPEAAARRFIDELMGPGVWTEMPREGRETMIRNAGTFADEQHDPEWASIDLEALGRSDRPALLTRGDKGPPPMAAVIDRLAAAIPRAEVATVQGAGHVPHETHPHEWASIVRRFAAGLD